MANQENVLVLNDGEILAVLIGRDKRSIEQLALDWGKSRQQINRYTKEEVLSKKVIKRACIVLNYPETIFKSETLDDLRARLADMERRVKILEAERDALKTMLSLVNLRLEDCERQSGAKTVKSN